MPSPRGPKGNLSVTNTEYNSMAVLDSACSHIVTRKLWFDIFFDKLDDQDKCSVKTAKSNRTFCFGDEVEVKAIKSVKSLVTIEGVKCVRAYIETDIVKK